MPQFCPNNQSIIHPWANDGIHRCFVDTLSTTVLSLLIVIPGIWMMCSRKRRNQNSIESHRRKSNLWIAHQVVCWLIPILLFVQPIVYAFARAEEQVYGFLISSLVANPLLWIFSIMLLRMDCRRSIFQTQYRHHNPVLLCFWFGALICTFLPVVSIRSSDWWWSMST